MAERGGRRMRPLVDAQWLKDQLDTPDLIVLDASWYLPAQGRDAEQEFLGGHIPGAQRFDFDRRFADTSSHLPHMMPTAAQFTTEARALGLRASSRIVIYDGAGIFAAPRAWWMFRAMGHAQVAVLNGGLPAWKAAGGATESGPARTLPAGDFTAIPDPSRIRSAAEVGVTLEDADAVVLDARSAARFSGAEQEARPGLRSGHMPGSVNLPFDRLLENGAYLPDDRLAEVLRAAGMGDRDAVASCGSGVTASIIALASEAALDRLVAVYDGAWAEWGQQTRPDLAVATGKG